MNTARKGRLDGRVVIVTGAGSGLGEAAALACADEGAVLVCAGTTLAKLEKMVEKAGNGAIARHVDIADQASTEALARFVEERFGRIDSLINVAGIPGAGSALDVDLEMWNRVLAVNLTGTWLMARAVLPAMIRQREGAIVLMSSLGGMIGVPALAAYSAAKGGVNALTKQMAVDYASYNIRVNAICPGTISSPLVLKPYDDAEAREAGAKARMMEKALKRWPVGRWGRPEEAAALCVLLASGECGFMTGTVTPLDGGMSATGWQVGQ